MILCVESLKVYTETKQNKIKSTRTNKRIQQVSGYKINSKKSVAFLYTKKKQCEKKMNKTSPFTMVYTKIKHLRINLTKVTKDLYTENNKMLLRELKEDSNESRHPCSLIESFNIIKRSVLPSPMHIFNAIFFKIPVELFFFLQK